MGPSGSSSNGSLVIMYNRHEMKENITYCPINTVLKLISGMKFTALLHI